MKDKVSLLVFDDVEVLDFAGPFEVFSVTNELNDYGLFDINLIAKSLNPVVAKNGLSINPHQDIHSCIDTDILIVPGGDGTRKILADEELLNWVLSTSKKAKLILSVCSGALILAKLGLLDGLQATTHHEVFEKLESLSSKIIIDREARFIDNGSIVTSAGISAGIDMSLYIIEKRHGLSVAQATAKYMEYAANK